jgi:hypothetical protein
MVFKVLAHNFASSVFQQKKDWTCWMAAAETDFAPKSARRENTVGALGPKDHAVETDFAPKSARREKTP